MYSISLSLVQLICEAYHFVSILITFYMTLNCTSVSDSQGVLSWFNRNLLGSMKPLVQSLPSSWPSLCLALDSVSASVFVSLQPKFSFLPSSSFVCLRFFASCSSILVHDCFAGAQPCKGEATVMMPDLVDLSRQSRAALGNHVQHYWLGASLNIK